jgi:predicted phosphodiesterase
MAKKKKAEITPTKGLQWITPLPLGKDYSYWSKRFKNRQKEYIETKEVLSNHFELRLPEKSMIALIGDQHVGSAEVDYERISTEINQILDTKNTYVIITGDTVDGYFWGGDAQYEEMEQVPEQYQYVKSMLDLLGENNKLICAVGGDHDGWVKRGGFNPLKEFTERNNCFYSQGVTYLTVHVGSATYKFTVAHRLPGSSMYNRNHPQSRALRFGGAIGSDIVVSGHNHRKAISQYPVDMFGGESALVHTIALGAYKTNDGYGRKLGFNKITADDMYGSAVILDKDNKDIVAYYDILKALKDIKK